MALRVGIDVGGTNTDAVLLRGDGRPEVVASVKASTSADVVTGVSEAIKALLADAGEKIPAAEVKASIAAVMIGTTSFINAIVQRRGLSPALFLRLAFPATTGYPPLGDWPEDLREAAGVLSYIVPGGFEFDGSLISPLGTKEIRAACAEAKARGITSVAIAGCFSPINASQELEAAEIVRAELGADVRISLSSDMSGIGLRERENSAILNACLRPLAHATINAFRQALAQQSITAPLFLTQNDGTLLGFEQALQHPVLTFASGATNSMRGAAFLSGQADAIVCDIGGTTLDTGRLAGGLAVEAAVNMPIAGAVATNFRMPETYSIGLGGGSIITLTADGSAVASIGPRSVGHELSTKALINGGDVLTASDIAVAAGWADFGSHPDKVRGGQIPASVIASFRQHVQAMMEAAIQKVKVHPEPLPVLIVGGGSILVPADMQLRGASEVVRPPNFSVANAVGAAIAQVSGMVDRVVSHKSAEERQSDAERDARAIALKLGAKEETITIVEREELGLAYIPGEATRVKVKAVGDLDLTKKEAFQSQLSELAKSAPTKVEDTDATSETLVLGEGGTAIDIATKKKDFARVWELDAEDIDSIAIGNCVLGSGGGGDPEFSRVRAQALLRAGKRMTVVSGADVGEDEYVLGCAYMGAPICAREKLPSGREIPAAVKSMHAQLPAHIQQNIVAITSLEMGGLNGLEPIIAAAEANLPCVDSDYMGRAFPELQMTLPFVHGQKPLIVSIADCHGKASVADSPDQSWGDVEAHFRSQVVQMGCVGGIALPPISGKDLRSMAVLGSLSRAWYIGKAVRQARADKADPVAAILSQTGGKVLAEGTVSAVQHHTGDGFDRGVVTVHNDASGSAKVHFQNEFVACEAADGSPLATAPDIITLVNAETGQPYLTDAVKFGLRVAVLGIPAFPGWTTPAALEVAGPAKFKLPFPTFNGLGGYKENAPHPKLA